MNDPILPNNELYEFIQSCQDFPPLLIEQLTKTINYYVNDNEKMIISDLIRCGIDYDEFTQFLCGACIVINDDSEYYYKWKMIKNTYKYNHLTHVRGVLDEAACDGYLLNRCIFGRLSMFTGDKANYLSYIQLEKWQSSWLNPFAIIWSLLYSMFSSEKYIAYGEEIMSDEYGNVIEYENYYIGPYGKSSYTYQKPVILSITRPVINLNESISRSGGPKSVYDIYRNIGQPSEYFGFHIL